MADKNMKTIAVTVTPEQNQFLEELVQYNCCTNKSHFVRIAIQLLEEQLQEKDNG